MGISRQSNREWEMRVLEPARARRAGERRARTLRRRRHVATLLSVLVASGAALVGATALWSDSGGNARSGKLVRRSQAARSAPRRLTAREDRAIDRVLAYSPIVRAGGGHRREIALTFDDGPGPYTPRIISILRHYHAPATFFEVGFMLRWFHSSTARQTADSFVVGDHTETHVRMGLLPLAAQRVQLLEQAVSLRQLGAPFPRLFRPPFGSYGPATLTALRGARMLMVLWSVDTRDYVKPPPKIIVQRAMAGARPGAVILLHDGGGNRAATVTALPWIVRGLRRRHLRLVSIPRLMLDDPPPRQRLPTHGRLGE